VEIDVWSQNPGGPQELAAFMEDLARDEALAAVSLRIASAYISRPGLQILARISEPILKRDGNVQLVLGYDPQHTRSDDLREAIRQFPHGSLFIVGAANVTFHPKIYLFEGHKTVAIIGSANATEAGLRYNWECSCVIRCSGDSSSQLQAQLSDIWDAYHSIVDYSAPLDDAWLQNHATNLALNDREQTRTRSRPRAPIFPRITRTRANRRNSRPMRQTTRRGASTPTPRLPRTLILEVLEETRNGTQVQVPVQCVTDYFGVDRDRPHRITLRIGEIGYDTSLLHFANNTHRLNMPVLGGMIRPLFLFLKRVPENRDIYECEIVEQASARFGDLEALAIKQTRVGSKRFDYF
jgi:PLD-like domain